MPQGSFSGDASYTPQDNKGKGREIAPQPAQYDVLQQHYQYSQPGGYSRGYDMPGNHSGYHQPGYEVPGNHSGYSQGYDMPGNQSGQELNAQYPQSYYSAQEQLQRNHASEYLKIQTEVIASWKASGYPNVATECLPEQAAQIEASSTLEKQYPDEFNQLLAHFSSAYTDDALRNRSAFASGSSQEVPGASLAQYYGEHLTSPGKTTYRVSDYPTRRAFVEGPGTYKPNGTERPQRRQMPREGIIRVLRGEHEKYNGWTSSDAPREYKPLPEALRRQRFSEGARAGHESRRAREQNR